ncbi:MAG: sigma-70 family RNA polymerase sigma factor [Planctomycetota bacterium]
MRESFATTRWTMVELAGRWRSGDRDARAALEALCAAYWPPLYAYVRRRGTRAEDAADLVQGFFARLLEKGNLAALDRERGRFRAFLLRAFQNFVANEQDRARARKRGGARVPVAIDVAHAEAGYLQSASDGETPERSFERAYALEMMACALDRLADEQAHAGKAEAFAVLRPHLTGGEDAAGYARAAAALGLTEGAVRVAVHRLRRRYGELLRVLVAETVVDPREVDDELRNLLAALA